MSKNADRINRIKARIESVVKEALNTTVTQQIANDVASQVRKRTRLGYGVDQSGNQIKLRPLTEEYIQTKRERYSENLSDATRPRRSNLTATGQMLDAIKGTGKQARIEISISGQRTRELDNRRSKLNNQQVASFVQRLRPFFALTNAERRNIVRRVSDIIRQSVKKRS